MAPKRTLFLTILARSSRQQGRLMTLLTKLFAMIGFSSSQTASRKARHLLSVV